MRALTATETRQAVRGRWLHRGEPMPILGASIDSRTAKENDLFIAIRGENFDGHDYLAAAADAGCIAAIVSMDAEIPYDLLKRFKAGAMGVPDTRTALLDLAGYYRDIIPAVRVAVTGSNGKTCVKRMIHHVLSQRLIGSCSPKSFNNDIGVPLTLLNVGAGDDYVVCEVGTNAPDEIANLARMLRPNHAVITNVGESHLERLESVERVGVEKASLLGWLDDRGLAVVYADSEPLDHALRSYDKRMVRFGESASAQLRLTGREVLPGGGQRFQINERQWVELALPGRHNALNAMATMAVCARFGFTPEDAAEALREFSGVEMRLEPISAGKFKIINDTYNANPASMRAAAEVLSEQTAATRRVMILGDMLELGTETEHLHQRTGEEMVRSNVDLLIGVGELGQVLADGAKRAGIDVEKFATVDDVSAALKNLLTPGDVILLKGSRGMKMERLVPVIEAIGNM